MMLLSLAIGIFFTAVIVIYIYYKYVVFDFWRKRGVIYIEPVVPTGNITEFAIGRKSLSELFQDAYLKYKDHRMFGTYMFFKPNLVIADFDLIRTVLTKEFSSFHDRGMYSNEKIDPLTAHLFVLPGEKWRKLRAKLSPIFTSRRIKEMFMVLAECGEDLTKYLENEVRTKNVFEIKEIFSRYTTDIIMSTAFGIKSNCIEEGDNEVRRWGKKFFQVQSLRNALAIFAPQILYFFSIPYIDPGVTKFFSKLFRDNVNYRKTNNVVRHDFLNLLMHLIEKGYINKDEAIESTNIKKLSMMEATAQAFVFFAAGFETSSTAATFCLYELALHQDIQNKLRREISETLEEHGGLTYDAIKKMEYFHKVIQETLRKYPPLGILNRICTKEITLSTVNIPKGTLISVPVFGIHRDPSVYPDPDKFDPERFNADQVAARHPYAYLPFGEGPRYCIGTRFGYLLTKVGIINLLSKFRFKLHPQTSVPLVFNEPDFILTAKGGVQLIVEPL